MDIKTGIANTCLYGINARLDWLEKTDLPLTGEWFRGEVREIEEAIGYCESLGANLSRQKAILERLKKGAATDHGPKPAA